MRPSAARDRLTKGVYVGTPDDPVGRVEHALAAVVATESITRRLRRAWRTGLIEAETPEEQISEALAHAIIDEDEAARLRAAERARFDAITVDEFPAQAFARDSRAES